MTRRKRHTEEQILKLLKELDSGGTVAAIAKAHGVTTDTIYRWRVRYCQRSDEDTETLRALQEENQRLKRIVARQALELDAYREASAETW